MAEDKKLTKLRPFPALSPEVDKPLAVALIREGEEVAPGQIQLHDILLLPKVYTEVAQVARIENGGTPEEEWHLNVLPPVKSTAPVLPWKITVKQLNGPVDVTGAHRPLGVIRLGKPLILTPMMALFADAAGVTHALQINSRGLVLPEGVVIPLNSPVRVFSPSVPSEGEDGR